MQGFIASDSENVTTTLGRGGSDYTGAILAAALDAEVLEIWTDVSGMMTADPRIVREYQTNSAHHLPRSDGAFAFWCKGYLSADDSAGFAEKYSDFYQKYFCARRLRNAIEAEAKDEKEIIRGITSIDKIAILSLEGSGMVGIPGFSKRLFDALSRAQINVILITQSSSEHSICVADRRKIFRHGKTSC